MTEDEQKLAAFSMIQNDKSPKDISETLQMAYPKVIKLRKDYREAVAAGTVDKLLNIDQLLVQRIAKATREEVSKVESIQGELVDEIDETAKGIASMNVLSVQLHEVARKLAIKTEFLIDTVQTPDSLLILVEALAKLQNAFFNRNMVNVNVLNQMNSGGSETSVTKFQAFKKA